MILTPEERKVVELKALDRNARHLPADNCSRCGWPLPLDGWTMKICPECNRVEVFKVVAKIAGRAILTEKNWLLRLQLIRKFFGVVVDTWEQQSILGPVRSVARR